MTYKYFEHTSDVIFEAYGKSLEELFVSAGLATEELMVELKTLSPNLKEEIKVKGKDVEELLYNFLEELIFLKDTKLLLFKEFQIKIKEGKEYSLKVIAKGEVINREKHELGRDVKAVTLHQFEVKKDNGKWKARVLIDI
ncbi:MAG: archease [Candidatus Nanoarchaeia archaeon]